MSESLEGLKVQAAALESWCIQNNLEVNTLKTKIMVMNSTQKRRNEARKSISFKGTVVDVVSEYKYLGLTFRDDLQWKSNFNALMSKLKSRSASLHFMFSCKSMSISARLSLYKSLMCPLYRYGAGIWSLTDHQLKLLERFHLGILKNILGCAKTTTTTTAAVYSETGMSPILFELDKSFFQFVGRLAVMNPVRLVSKLFLFSAEDDVFTVKGGDRKKKSPWRHRLDALINEYNLEESFQNLKSSTISHEMWKSRVKSAVWKARCAHVKSALSSAVKYSICNFIVRNQVLQSTFLFSQPNWHRFSSNSDRDLFDLRLKKVVSRRLKEKRDFVEYVVKRWLKM